MMKGPIFFDMNVEFEDIRFLRATAMSKTQAIDLNIMVHTGTGQFEITGSSEKFVCVIMPNSNHARSYTADRTLDESLLIFK